MAVSRILRNLATVPELDKVVLAVPDNNTHEDAVMLFKIADNEGASIWYGPEHDVLGRYAGAAAYHDAEVIIRITCDTPLIDPALVSNAIKAYKGEGYYMIQGYPRGVGDIELFSRKALDKANREEQDADNREHVWRAVAFAATRASRSRTAVSPVRTPWCPDEFRRPYRLCVDEQADLDVVRAVLEALGNPPVASVGEIVALLDGRPDLVALNAHVKQAS